MAVEKLDEDAVQALKQARSAQQTMEKMGIPQESSEKLVESTAYETFVEIQGLPSANLFYNSPIRGQALKVEDILLLSNLTDDNYQDKFNQIFARRISGIKPREMLVCDELFFAFWLRESAFPNLEFPGNGHTCIHCKTEHSSGQIGFHFSDVTFSIDKLQDIYNEFKVGNGKVNIELPGCKKSFRISMRTRGHIDRYKESLKRDFYAFGKEPPEDLQQILPMATVLNIGEGQDLREVADEIKKLSAMDFLYLLKAINKYSLIAEPIIEMPCMGCKEVTPVKGYIFLSDTFIPIDQI